MEREESRVAKPLGQVLPHTKPKAKQSLVPRALTLSRKERGSRSPWRERLRVRFALRVDDLFQFAKHVHAGQHLREARVRLALLIDGSYELAVLELDTVHRHVYLGHVDL